MHVQSAPLIQNIKNNTSFGFVVLRHSDTSGCSLHGLHEVIEANSVFNHEFLLELGIPSLVLRPIYFISKKTNQKMFLTDEQYNYVPEKVELAYELWKKETGIKKFPKSNIWLEKWVGGDIFIIPYSVEIFGYLVNLSRVTIQNSIKKNNQWLSFAKGIFSKIVLELEIGQSLRKGILATIQTLHGEGGVCIAGVIERI